MLGTAERKDELKGNVVGIVAGDGVNGDEEYAGCREVDLEAKGKSYSSNNTSFDIYRFF